ncbi:unnamed protein product [Blepharisma stoltei]|uniref:Uncharacterized protein n=1 Tax=Blepharisma stoltei TaxID=1481888 RepID=A0AAU9ISA5_9CILI|nr:unnamed protein product [Blepharisma stoltei]
MAHWSIRSSDSISPRDDNYYMTQVDIMKSSLKETELSLVRSLEKNAMLVTKLEEAQDEIERSHDQLENQALLVKSLKQRCQELESQARIEEQPEEWEILNYKKQIEVRENQIDELAQVIRCKERAIETLTSNQVFSQEQFEGMKQELEEKTKELELLQRRLRFTEKSIDNLYLNNRTEGELMLEVEHMRNDNKRLLELLNQTQEYKHLAQYLEDSKGAHYVQSSKRSKKGQKTDELENWVPQEIFKLIDVYKKSPNELTDNVLHTLVLELNTVWRERERTQIEKLKNKYKTQILDLKRQLFMRQPYDTIKSQKKVSYLKTELKKVNDDLKQNFSSKTTKLGPGIDSIESTLKLISKLQEENNKLKREIVLLKKKTENNDNKSKLIESMGKLGEQVIQESTKMHQLINNLLTEFEENPGGEKGNTKREWLLDNIEKIVGTFSGNVEVLVDSTYRG